MVAVGIDFGNAYSCVGIWRNESVDIVANDQGNRQNPSLVAFNEQERLAGEAAKSQAAINPENTIYDIKFLLGRKFTDSAVQAKLKSWPFKVVAGKGDQPMVEVAFKGKKQRYSAEDLAAMLLTELAQLAGKFIGSTVTQAVLSMPSSFSPEQQAALLKAAKIAKLDILRLIKDPIAAAVGHSLDDAKNEGVGSQSVCVFDFGAGTCDVGLVGVDSGLLTLKEHAQDEHLGGAEFENRLMQHFSDTFERKNKAKIEGEDERRALGRLRTVCQNALRSLSSSPQASIELDSLFKGHDLYESISRAKFEALVHDLLKRCLRVFDSIFQKNAARSEIKRVLLVGGCTRIPKLRTMISEYWGEGVLVDDTKSPSELIATGAALQANLLQPHAGKHVLNTFPELQGTSLSLGVAVSGGVVYPVVPRGTVLPCTRTVELSTAVNDQQTAIMRVYQGERLKADANSFLGNVVLKDLPKAARGATNVRVTFAVDLDAKLTVAVSHPSGTSTETVLGAGAKEVDADKAVKDAQDHREEDENYFKQLVALQGLRTSAAELQARIKANEVGKDAVAKVKAACGALSKWLEELDISGKVPAMGIILAKGAELQAAAHEAEEDDEDDDEDEGDESDSEEDEDDDDDDDDEDLD